MLVPSEIVDAVNEAIPVPKHFRDRMFAKEVHRVVYHQLGRASYNSDFHANINRELVDIMHGDKQRKAIMRGVTELFETKNPAISGVSNRELQLLKRFSDCYTSTKSTIAPTLNGTPAESVSDLPARDWRSRYVARDMSSCDVVTFEGRWRVEYSQKTLGGIKKLWKGSTRYRRDLKWSLGHTFFTPVTIDECLSAADKSIEKKIAKNKLKENSLKRDELAEVYFDSWARMIDDPCHFCFRQGKTGRVYWGLCNQTKRLRRSNILFQWDGQEVPGVEVDVSASHFTVLATLVNCQGLRDAVAEGRPYETLAEACTASFKDRDALKVSAQIQCLFGRDKFGKQPLFGAMYSIWPEVAEFVMHVRRTGGGSRGLAKLLMEAEGSFVWDQFVPALRESGIPSLPIHDGLIVPEPVSENVADYGVELMRNTLGVTPSFSIK